MEWKRLEREGAAFDGRDRRGSGGRGLPEGRVLFGDLYGLRRIITRKNPFAAALSGRRSFRFHWKGHLLNNLKEVFR